MVAAIRSALLGQIAISRLQTSPLDVVVVAGAEVVVLITVVLVVVVGFAGQVGSFTITSIGRTGHREVKSPERASAWTCAGVMLNPKTSLSPKTTERTFGLPVKRAGTRLRRSLTVQRRPPSNGHVTVSIVIAAKAAFPGQICTAKLQTGAVDVVVVAGAEVVVVMIEVVLDVVVDVGFMGHVGSLTMRVIGSTKPQTPGTTFWSARAWTCAGVILKPRICWSLIITDKTWGLLFRRAGTRLRRSFTVQRSPPSKGHVTVCIVAAAS